MSSGALTAATPWSVSRFNGETGVRVDQSLALPGGVSAARGLHLAALARLIRMLRGARSELVLAHSGDAFKYVALATRSPIVVDDADALSRAVSGLVRDPERRQVKEDAARHRRTSLLALSVVADRWDALFTLIAAARDMRLTRAATLEPLRGS